MRLLLDTNILLDSLLSRPGAKASEAVMSACGGLHQGAAASHTIATLYDLLSREKGDGIARFCLQRLLDWLEIASVGGTEVARALKLTMSDYEDAMQAAAAESDRADFIITRNVKDFKNSPVPALTPEQFLKRFPLAP
jgi:predicted nucleic acid-binding protein